MMFKTTQKIHFTKMHGAGNDYIYVDTSKYSIADPSRAAIAWSDRHKGIGSDGLVLIGRSSIPEADFTMRIFNADGSEAMMCGNASRCIGKYVYEKGLTDKTTVKLLTPSGIKTLLLKTGRIADDTQSLRKGVVEEVTVDMQEPALEQPSQFAVNAQQGTPIMISSLGTTFRGTFVSMGNPHFVIFVDNIDKIDVALYGSSLEHHPFFPERCNIEFAQPLDDKSIRTRVWERGSGITQACGTGACATAVAACLTGITGRRSHIIMDGGALDIEWSDSDHHVYMTGPATFVFDGEAYLQLPL